MKLTRLKINGMETPLGANYDVLNVSWNVEYATGTRAENVKVEVARDELFEESLFTAEDAELSCAGTPLKLELKPRTRYFVRVTVTDDCGECGTGMTWFETGKMEEEWQAKWVGLRKEDEFHPILKKRFSAEKNKIPVKARLYMCGLGVYETYLNGKKVGNEVLAPFMNDYRFALQTETYDVTELLQAENELDIYLGNGWYKGRFGQNERKYGERFAAIAELHMEYADGGREVIRTDETWNYCGSDVEASGIYDGEIFNRILWNEKENVEKSVEILNLDKKLLTDRYSMPVIVKETLPVKEVLRTPAGETVLDMGQNFTGWMEFKAHLPKGTKVHLEFGEVLQNGNFYNENYRTATGGFVYISDGRKETVRPHFTFFGFRYVRVTGWVGELKAEDFTGCAIYSDLEQTGFLETSDARVNQLISNCLWGQKSNFLDLPTDCPQRDERLGWTADAQVFTPTATYNMDTRAFYRKYLWDMRQVQKRMGGAVPAYLPQAERMCPVCSVWGDAATLIPYALWKAYADSSLMEELYPLMKDWVDYISREMNRQYGKNVGIWDFTFHFGDWLALDGANEQSVKGGTSEGYLATMYYYRSASIVAEISEELGKTEEAEIYIKLAEEIKECLLYEYFTPAGHLSIVTQAAYVVALKFGVYRDKDVLVKDFLKLLEKHDYKIKCGFVGAPLLCQVLSECGQSNLAYRFLLQKGFPSWLYAVDLGATTIWERWNSILPDGSISGTGMNSLNHYSYGSVIEFLYAYAAGLRPAKAGYEHVVIAPEPNGRLRFLNCTYQSPAGAYVVNWKLKDNGDIAVHLEIPFGCNAEVTLPECDRKTFTAGAGVYDYEYAPVHDYRIKFDENTKIMELFGDEQAKEILFKYIPHAAFLDNPIAGGNKIGSLYGMEFIGITREMAENVLTALKELKRW